MAISMAAAMMISSGISAGGSIIGSIIGSNKGAKAQREANKIAREQLEFAKQRYQDWQDTWGDVEESIASFARTYTGAHAQSLGLRAIEGQFKEVQTQMKEFNAQRGLSNSGLGAHQQYQLNLARHQSRAEVIADAPSEAAKVRADLFNVGAQREGGLLNARAQASGNAINTLTSGRDRSDALGANISGKLTNFLTEGGGSEYLANKFKNFGNKRGVNARGKISLFEEQGVG